MFDNIWLECGIYKGEGHLQIFTYRVEDNLLSVSQIIINQIIDYEHRRIIQELIALGITPTYNKSADRALLAKAKAEISNKIEHKIEQKQFEEKFFEEEFGEVIKAQENMTGLTALSELNKYFLVRA